MEALSAAPPSEVESQVGGAPTGGWGVGLLGGAVVDGATGPVWLPQGSQPVPTITGVRILHPTITTGTLVLTTLTVIRIIIGQIIRITMVLPITTATDWSIVSIGVNGIFSTVRACRHCRVRSGTIRRRCAARHHLK